jgi:hypothetical protein
LRDTNRRMIGGGVYPDREKTEDPERTEDLSREIDRKVYLEGD